MTREQPDSDRRRVLAVRHRAESAPSCPLLGSAFGRKTVVTVHDERQIRADAAQGAHAIKAPQFNGKEQQVVDVVARWILTGAAPDEIR